MTPSGVRDCVFCEIVRGEAEASIVREDESTLAFMDIRPMTPGHVLVVPKAHAATVEELPVGAAGPILEAARDISGALRRSGLKCDAVSFYLANGREAGQEVLHVHLHLIPRSRGDGFGLRVPADYGRRADRLELEKQAREIRGALAPSGAGELRPNRGEIFDG
jgi:diadenosine tetraphosphate (Ap4A) HIT family hydrolase